MRLRIYCILFGIGFVSFGVTGFLPNSNDYLFGLLQVGIILSAVNIAAGVLAIMAATNAALTKRYFQLFSILSILTGLISIVRGGDLFVTDVNMPMSLLYIILGALAFYLGFILKQPNKEKQ